MALPLKEMRNARTSPQNNAIRLTTQPLEMYARVRQTSAEKAHSMILRVHHCSFHSLMSCVRLRHELSADPYLVWSRPVGSPWSRAEKMEDVSGGRHPKLSVTKCGSDERIK